jgi:hypothetical protein
LRDECLGGLEGQRLLSVDMETTLILAGC